MSIVLTNDPLLFGVNLLMPNNFVMSKACKSFATTNGNSRVTVRPAWGLSHTDILRSVDDLHEKVQHYSVGPGGAIMFGWSRGCQVIAELILKHMRENIVLPHVRVVLIGNLTRPVEYGGDPTGQYLGGGEIARTPIDSPYPILDVARKGDKYANYPGTGTLDNTAHMNYFDVDLNTLDDTMLSKVEAGNATFYVVP